MFTGADTSERHTGGAASMLTADNRAVSAPCELGHTVVPNMEILTGDFASEEATGHRSTMICVLTQLHLRGLSISMRNRMELSK